MQGFRAFLINLDRDGDRLAYMREQLERYGVSFERVPAVMGNSVPAALSHYFQGEGNGAYAGLSAGEIGCYASHLLIHKRIVDEKMQSPVLVLEDDLEFSDDLRTLLNELSELPSDWEIIRLSNPAKSAATTVSRLPSGSRVVRYWRVPNNTGAYLVNAKGAEKFLRYAGIRFRAVDEDLRRPWEHGVVTYGVLPPPIRSNIFDSSIDALSGPRSLPARKRFSRVKGETWRAFRYRLGSFGVMESARMLIANVAISLKRKMK